MKYFFLHIVLLFCTGIALGQTTFEADKLLTPRSGKQSLVTDLTNTLTPSQAQALENKLVALDDSTSTQVAVIIVPNTGDIGVADYATELGRAWGVGGKEFNNGVVFLISKDKHQMHIATGYGLEGSLTDATSSYILDEVVTPAFRGDDYYRGIDDGTDAIIQAVHGTYHAPGDRTSGSGKSGSSLMFIIIVIIIIIIMSNRGGKGGGTFMSRRGYRGMGPFIFPMGGGGFGGSGGGGFGGGGGGGFGGFGGGGFGGGGASGSW